MKKTTLKTSICVLAIAAVCLDYTASAQGKKSPTRSVIINNGDTVVNGKKFNELDRAERIKLRKEFKEMEKKFRSPMILEDRDIRNVVIRKSEKGSKDIIFNERSKEPKVLYWDDNINGDVGASGNVRMFKFEGDSLFQRDLKLFKFNGDSSMSFSFNSDSLLKGFNFRMDGLDTNLRKRIITMHRDLMPGRPAPNLWRGEGSGLSLERRPLHGFYEKNNSATFNYNYTDKDGISTYMSIRLNDVDKDQLKKISGTDNIIKELEISDLTLFPNFSTGKISLSFNANTKGLTKINILDSGFKSIYSDEAANFTGNYIRQLTLPKNGVYYVTITQNGSWFIKRLIKE